MGIKSISFLILFVLLLAACIGSTPTSDPAVVPSSTSTLEFTQPTLVPTVSSGVNQTPAGIAPTASPQSNQQVVMDLAFEVVKAIQGKDMVTLSQHVHPQMGLRFSPYATVKDSDQVFSADKVAGLLEDKTVYLWGNLDGNGEPINLTFADYYPKFVYDVDFVNAPQHSLNHKLGTGNSIDNAQEFYPGAMIVEFYFPGFDPQYNGIDWRSLRLVFMQSGEAWYLAGIVHDQWTI